VPLPSAGFCGMSSHRDAASFPQWQGRLFHRFLDTSLSKPFFIAFELLILKELAPRRSQYKTASPHLCALGERMA